MANVRHESLNRYDDTQRRLVHYQAPRINRLKRPSGCGVPMLLVALTSGCRCGIWDAQLFDQCKMQKNMLTQAIIPGLLTRV